MNGHRLSEARTNRARILCTSSDSKMYRLVFHNRQDILLNELDKRAVDCMLVTCAETH